ncbi:outer membrane lipoprotein chaperone LolA [Noviherbaspirillum galbum]|uniref:Outer-membrane lipoprotein carrier protein n=1 Tax=Noviherbaspirillum galbum TaxID=2709383 RepID=A0A6B3SQH9_9BURK|nr:outer membrane lipoprotein chaperone LolA [Noviherbaspirillum galbum]NEX61565.1 outer membrane lipoprotein chaperone LolA [Noviherbaspirillum galbum]
MPKLIQTAIFAACALALSGTAFAGALDQFRSFATTTKTARGQFTQRQVKAVQGSPKVSNAATGTFAFARPGRFVWTYLKPYEQVMMADGEKLYLYDKDLNQVTVKNLDASTLGSSPAAILFGSNDLEKNFVLKDAGSRDGMEWLDATPRSNDSTFERLSIGLKDGVPRAMELRDSFGQLSLISFDKFDKNPALPADEFKFVPPKGADVFQQ